MTHQEAVKIIGLIGITYPDREIPEETVALWTQFILDLPYLPSQKGVMNFLGNRQSDFLPSIGSVRQAIIQSLPGKELLSAGEAWAEVMAKIVSVGIYGGTPTWSCEAVKRAAMSIGWRNLCLSENMATDRAHFMRIYEDFREREMRQMSELPWDENLSLPESPEKRIENS